MAATGPANTPEERNAYEQSWRVLLRELLGWSDEKAAAWARDKIRAVGGNPFLTHEHTAWAVTPLLVPAEVKAVLGPRLNAFCGRLELAICCCDPRHVTDLLSADYDWDAARSRVRRLVESARAGTDPDQMVPRGVPPAPRQDGREA